MNKILRFANKIGAWYAWHAKLPYVRASSGSETSHDVFGKSFVTLGEQERDKPFGIYLSMTNKYGADAWRTQIGRHDQVFPD